MRFTLCPEMDPRPHLQLCQSHASCPQPASGAGAKPRTLLFPLVWSAGERSTTKILILMVTVKIDEYSLLYSYPPIHLGRQPCKALPKPFLWPFSRLFRRGLAQFAGRQRYGPRPIRAGGTATHRREGLCHFLWSCYTSAHNYRGGLPSHLHATMYCAVDGSG